MIKLSSNSFERCKEDEKTKLTAIKIYTLFLIFICLLSCNTAIAAEEHLTEQITITAAVQPPIVTKYPRHSDPPNSDSGVPLSTEAGTDTVLFRGKSYPGGIVSILKNGLVLSESPVAEDGSFEIGIHELNAGVYTFGVQARDASGLQSSLDVFTVYIADGVTTIVNGIFLSPTVTTDLISVKQGERLTVSGKSTSNAYISITINTEPKGIKHTQASENGDWLYVFDSAELPFGEYIVQVRASTADELSSLSEGVSFLVSQENIIRQNSRIIDSKAFCDLNNDRRVNIRDFSILAFWYKQKGFPAKVDLNRDRGIDITDFSILAWCWTG